MKNYKTSAWLSNLNTKRAFSLKAITLLLLTFCSTLSNAQNPCGCTPTSTVYQYTYNNPSCPGYYIDIEFTMVQCGSSIGILFNKATGYNTNNPYPNNSYNGCNTFIFDRAAAQQEVLNMYGAGSNITFTYPAACNAVVEVDYGNDTCYRFPQEGPLAGQAVGYNLGVVYQTVPCTNTSCCKTEWIFNSTTDEYHQSIDYPVVNCENDTPILTTIYGPECLDRHGIPQSITGTATSIIAPCYSFCDPLTAELMLKTSTGSTFKPMPEQTNISLAPVPASNTVIFSDTKNISKINIYDVNGKKVLEQNAFENNAVNISQLKAGIHFVHVFFKNNTLRTIKIIKE